MKSVFLLALVLAAPARADLARWADPGLPVREGLEWWLDATRENEAREAHYMNRLADGQPLDIWHDSSGHARHLTQWSATARPAWRQGTVAFETDDFLAALVTPGLSARELTVFIVAAPDRASGDFPALVSVARREENDFTSGLTVDFGRAAARPATADTVNVEGAGQTGESNLLGEPIAADHGHVFTVVSSPGTTVLRLNGNDRGSRPRGDVAVAIDRIAVGARFVEPAMRHFFNGRLAEVLWFNRRLDPAEIERIETWLARKHAPFLRALDPKAPRPVPLVAAKDAPVVQMLVPGFRVDELPMRLTNLNNIEYAPDGRLFAGGYDGRFHLLRDADGDGLEDRVDTFSGETTDNYPLGMVVKDGMPHALLADEIIRFRDADGDGIPESRESVVRGWDDPALRDDPALMHRRVDSALGLAAGPDGSWFVTMGSANPGNGYWLPADRSPAGGADVKAGYSPDKRRGCLLRLDPDGTVTQLASGLRYIMSLQWDHHGELFATDQEGATWLPNGNPFDELLHLQTGRHYGFPPRHPRLLPGVIDEPSVWDFAPQHQSTCGFRFNGPAPGRACFGPSFWEHDALVTGEARGKLWRTTLARTAAGYVAHSQLIAALGMLVVDCAISPAGDLVVCGHSGPPDWGLGPSHPGRVFKIRYVDTAAPQPVLAWARDATTSVIAFDRPLDPAAGNDLASRVTIESGRHVAAADRFESLRPGYAVVRAQESEPRFRLPVTTATLSADHRHLVIETAPRTRAVGYAITVDTPRPDPGLPQAAAIDLAHSLTGLQAAWQGRNGATWDGWLPHPDFQVTREITRGSHDHDVALAHFTEPGTLVLRTRLDLSHLLQPRTQPGSSLDYSPEPETVTLTVLSDAAVTLKADGTSIAGTTLTRTITSPAWLNLELEIATPATRLEMTFHTALDPRPRPLGLPRFFLPFADPPDPAPGVSALPELAGGDWHRGRDLYHGKAACATCHTLNGQGHAVGPDLGNSIHRDYASLLRDITEPNASINPDAVAYQITSHDGTVTVGTRAGESSDTLRIAQPGGQVTAIPKSSIRTTEALPQSLMPAGLLDALSPPEIKDLLTFLMTTPPAGQQ